MAAALGLSECSAGTFTCSDESDCIGSGADGVCQPDGFCSFPDAACSSGQRYGSHSGALSGECVPQIDDTTGDPTLPTDTSTSSSTSDPVTTLPLDATATDADSTSAPTSLSESSTSPDPDSSGDGSVVDEDLLLWLTFDDRNDDVIANDGTLGGAAACAATQCPITTTGVLGEAYLFDGVDDCVRFESTPELEGMDQLTIAVWVRLDMDGVHYGFVDKPIGGSFNNSWALYYYPARGGSTQLFAMTDGMVGNNLTSADPLIIGEWVHIAGTWDGVDMALWVDGGLVSTGTAPQVAFDEQPVLVGCDDDHLPEGPNGLLAGAIDDVRVYARALDADEIAALAAQRSP